ncbi:hypothetical protein MF406_10770 [Georgenia sp. TF02-10]|uniref:hypothetical protein n=1 Tax=Georgenia sp. TF02-10 TaxID=2917725 RepID=UPI001FA7C6EB|nr:hypothetical protein [Georgenia sp. TF02-10]UNX53480.1 hypothetical protein MF406_10770 [Georgenia sp. TF02-10]
MTATATPTTTDETAAALDVARDLAAAGVPIFLARRAVDGSGKWDPKGGHNGCGYWLPAGWEMTKPDPAVLDRWTPGMAVCALMGQAVDGLDFDPRNGGRATFEALRAAGMLPTVYGRQTTPSGGIHGLIAPLGERSKDGLRPGLDYKGGAGDKGRGILFLAPTERASKADGKVRPYRWTMVPDLTRLAAEGADDDSGAAITEMVRASRKVPTTTTTTTKANARPLSPARKAGLLRSAVEPELERLRECRRLATPDGKGYTGPPWDATTFAVACTLIEHENAGLLDPGEADRLILAEAPRDAGFTDEDVHEKLKSAHAKVGDKARDYGPDHDEGMFDAEPASPAKAGTSKTSAGERPELNTSNAAVTLSYLRANLGTGPTAGIFRRLRELVYTPRVGEDGYVPAKGEDDDGPAQVHRLDTMDLTARLNGTYSCYRVVDEKKKPMLFPQVAAQQAVKAPDLLAGVRPLRGVTHSPIVRADGTVLDEPGYDDASGFLYLPPDTLTVPKVPAVPSEADRQKARGLVEDMLADFPFVSADHRASYIGFLLTPLLRLLVPPPYKLCVLNAPQPGSGKGLLAKILGILHGSTTRATLPAGEAEMDKSIMATLDTTTAPVVVFDNVESVVRSPTLAALLTVNVYSSRRLGNSENISRPNDRLWTVTGNNVRTGGDISRRAVFVTIDPGMPHPERRVGFKINNLLAWVEEHRGDLLWALLTLTRAWVVAGRPMGPLRTTDDFSTWKRSVEGVVRHAGFEGRFDSDEAAPEDAGLDSDSAEEFYEAIYRAMGSKPWRAGQVYAEIAQVEGNVLDKIPMDVVPEEVAVLMSKGMASRAFGQWIAKREGRWAGQYSIRRAGRDAHSKVVLWRVVVAGEEVE